VFTLSSGQIRNSLSDAGIPDSASAEFLQATANCAQPLTHRGGVSFSSPPPSQQFPGLQQPPGTNISIFPPPWQNEVFQPQPFIDVPSFGGGCHNGQYGWQEAPASNITSGRVWGSDSAGPMTDAVGGMFEDGQSMCVSGPSQFGDVSANGVNTGGLVTQEIYNEGPTWQEGDVFVEGNSYYGGDTVMNNKFKVVKQSTFNGPVTNNDLSVHNGPVENNNEVNNFGPTNNFNSARFFGPTIFHGHTFVDILFGGGVAMPKRTFEVVTEIGCIDGALKYKTQEVTALCLLGGISAWTDAATS